jgi:hypothetical protein
MMRSTQDAITELQLRIPRRPAVLRTRDDYRRTARWWELEARRSYPSYRSSLEYAANMRWAAEMVYFHGPGTWLELKSKASTT